ncbi:putative ATP-dependent zinc protease [Methanolobus psychrotolerans]|uniref:putative ATP-dependent zinc protease n=1 Tax=Methanolobus psychrotolerans TaxID=1874706 RepID=UPI000B91AF50|nr:RimK/LysX family protein [Methanolobus psychrotolerans]
MKINDLKAILKFSAREEAMFGRFDLPKDAFYPMVLSLKVGGAWSYSTEDLKSISVMKVFTTYNEETRTGHTIEEVYLLLNPEYVSKEGIVYRLEKCGGRDERVLLTRPYSVVLKAERIIVASVSTERKKIFVKELDEKNVSFTGPSAFYADHEMEHLEHIEIDGLPMWAFEYEEIKS